MWFFIILTWYFKYYLINLFSIQLLLLLVFFFTDKEQFYLFLSFASKIPMFGLLFFIHNLKYLKYLRFLALLISGSAFLYSIKLLLFFDYNFYYFQYILRYSLISSAFGIIRFALCFGIILFTV